MIQSFISFEGTLNSWWTKIVVGALLFLFILLQTWVVRSARFAVPATKNPPEAAR